MPVTLVDRLPLPSLKVYTAGSVVLLSSAVYYALSVTSDPNWRVNATQPQDMAAEVAPGPVLAVNSTRNITEQFVEVMTFMMQEPLCMWTVINIAFCCLGVLGYLVQRLVFGRLRVSEAQRVKDKFWNYVFYKFIFVFGVINVQYMDEVLLWCCWFTVLGFLQLHTQLCKDRFDYLSSSPNTGRWAHARLLSLLAFVQASSAALLVVAALWGLPHGTDVFVFMAAECVLVLISALHVVARYVLQMYEADAAGHLAYYTHLTFESALLIVELLDVVHMVVYSNMLVSMASLVLLMQMRHLLHELQARLRRHRLYTALKHHMRSNYPMASKEEVEKNQDNCAICWEPMKEARKLPCSHLFHNSCLCQWVQQDASCPTCRRSLAGAAPPARAPPHNQLFHFDGSRYVSWLPSFSVEVTRVRVERAPPAPHVLDGMARQVQQMFPQFPLSALSADLQLTRSADVTVDNILEGRLLPPTAPSPPRDVTREITPEEPSPPRTLHSDHPIAHAHIDGSTDTNTNPRFSTSVLERQKTLERRKAALLAAARQRYLRRAANTSSSSSSSPASSPTSPEAAETAPHS
ncbi:E3 ubiquitin-protein ligase AMFR [Amyelois transitella]|uniref:E3 ubiquitin-protein ligase AMFR n=1 Tax=Amyelois transitella TaxID=680683 RepID=UPI00067C56C7|nr:E3 ubiquitin-protein ligase AMFR [Amyelois transitella]